MKDSTILMLVLCTILVLGLLGVITIDLTKCSED